MQTLHQPFSRMTSVATVARWIGALSIGIALAGCNTMRGLGQDVERGGERVQDAATNVQKQM